MNSIKNIVVHISDSPFGCAREIRKWHMDPKRPAGPFADIGYHAVILNGQIGPGEKDFVYCAVGSIEFGRPLNGDSLLVGNEIGAHARGYNDRSIGICGIGKDGWHPKQVASLITLCRNLMRIYGIYLEGVLGHCETEMGKKQGKTCPDLDMDFLREQISGV